MGEGGIQPDYFLKRMQWWEINRFMSGLHRRYRNQWLTTRHIEWFMNMLVPRGKDATPPPDAPDKLYKFAWEKDDEPRETITEEEAQELQELIQDFKW